MDTIDAAYHDSASGAFVRLTIASPVVATPLETGPGVEPGTIDGVAYRIRVSPSREPACRDLEASLFPNGPKEHSWNFLGTACTEEQLDRIKSPIFGKAAVAKTWTYHKYPLDIRSIIKPEDVEKLTPGTPWTEILASLGVPGAVSPGPAQGFTVEYERRLGRPESRLVLELDRAQQLVQTTVR